MQEQLNERRRAAEKVTLIGSLLDTVLGVLKIVIGIFANSAALVADGLHSLSDLLTDFLVIAVLRLSHQAPDRNHPWGHGRFETVGTVVLGVILVTVGGLMAWESVDRLFAAEPPPLPTWPALVAAGLSIAGKEWIFRYSLKIGKELKSDLLIANAWHSRTDALSSIVVLVAVAGAMMGVWWLDALAAVLVALMVGKIGWDLVTRSISELVDTALPEERVKALRETVLSVEGIESVHSFKSRQMGNQSLLEMHLQVDPHLSAAEGHYIGDVAVLRLKDRFDDIGHVIFHIDTYDDQVYPEDSLPVMPPRTEVAHHIDAALSRIIGENPDYELTLFYHPEYIDLDLKVSPEMDASVKRSGLAAEELERHLIEQLGPLDWFRNLRIWLPANIRG
ncbi:MAG: cation transporter [Oceanospirillaceae bacterium]|jgi:cation diffusion facilitator family transporter|uniref:cation diffusion facilitator family transporter n=1 Tax=Marinobacterium litorale TaxID=404770 RepID=UPI00041DC8D9|nr:cation diffusion facilitator family transporter [Marinobacterium litorale]MBS98613.1 cation transporter [Oceanospirillaceae bacterium]